MNLPKKVKIVEVGPRDGLQNEPTFVPTDVKVELINQLSQTGLSAIEAGSFVSPKAIPQLADSEDVFKKIDKHSRITYPALVPNIKGLERAISAEVSHIALFAGASETFSQKNIQCSIDESLKRFEQVVVKAKQNGFSIRAYVSCVLGCPYEGDIKKEKVAQLTKQLFDLGADEVSLGDTIGIGTATKCVELINAVCQSNTIDNIAMHFHNTYGQACANIYASLTCGVSIFDSAIAGLGGCPYAKGATGNVSTEDVVYMLQGMNIETGIDLMKLAHVGHFICQKINRKNQSYVGHALLS